MGWTDFSQAKIDGRKLSMATCYDYTFARLLARTSIDAILVGDSAAMVMHGHSSTLPATVEMMRLHTEAVSRGAPEKFIVADMPFLSFRKGPAAALDTAAALMTAGAQAVKLEGIAGHEDVVERMVQSGIPVMGHLGLQPQSVHAYGGYRVQGRSDDSAGGIARDAATLERLGAFAVVLECVPASVAGEITASLRIPTIGIGAGAQCDGQVLVTQDMLGLTAGSAPKFVKRFADLATEATQAFEDYIAEVRQGTYPDEAHSHA